MRNAHEQLLSLLVQVLAVWTSPETARLVESGLHDTDRYKRASALEALESLSSHRFTRFLLPILTAEEGGHGDWRAVAHRQWQLTYPDVRTMLQSCVCAVRRQVDCNGGTAGRTRTRCGHGSDLVYHPASPTLAPLQRATSATPPSVC